MAFLDTLKELAGTVVETVKEHPVAAAGITAGVLVVGGGAMWYRRSKKAAAAEQCIAAAVAPINEQLAATPAPEAAPVVTGRA